MKTHGGTLNAYSLTRWTWVWVNSRSWWWTGRPGVLWFMGSPRVRHDWATELNWTLIPRVTDACSQLYLDNQDRDLARGTQDRKKMPVGDLRLSLGRVGCHNFFLYHIRILFYFLNYFYWTIVDLQCCVSFSCIVKWIRFPYTHIHSFLDSLFHNL